MDFSKTYNTAKKELKLGSSGFFGLKDDESKKLRFVSDAIPYQSPNKFKPGTLRTQFLCYVIDRTDQLAKPYLMPVSVMDTIAELQESEDYGWPKGKDIPYDITIKRSKEKGITSYSVLPSPKLTNLTAEEKQMVEELKPLEHILERLTAKQEPVQDHQSDIQIDDEDMPD